MVVRDGQNRAYSARYGARDPLLAPWPRLAVYLAWRCFMALLRPVLFLTLLICGGALLIAALQRAPGPVAPQVSLDQSIQEAFANASPQLMDRRGLWLDGLDGALQSRPRAAPDLPLAESYLEAAIAIEGREALALSLLGEGRRRASVEADLRARSAARRASTLDEAIDALLNQGRDAGMQPATLILAPAHVRNRLARMRSLYGPALEEAGRWFVNPQGRALTISSLPGAQARTAVLYGDARDVIVHGCAFAQSSGRRVGACRVGFLPKPEPDPILAGLSLAVLWADEQTRVGARIAKGAYAAGHLPAPLADRIAFGPDPELGRQALLASVMPILVEAGEAWTQPVRYQALLHEAAEEAAASARINATGRTALFEALGAVRRETGALAALRLSGGIGSSASAERLALLAERAGPQLLALSDLSPDDMETLLIQPEMAQPWRWSRWPQRAKLEAGAGTALILASLLILFTSLVAGILRVRSGRPGWLEQLDSGVTRLMLGKNS